MDNLIRSERIKQGRTILEISRVTEISPSDISQVELGKKVCYPSWRKRLSGALNVPESMLFPESAKKGAE